MLTPALPTTCYTDAAWFEKERTDIFGKLWVFAGLTQQLQQENDFLTRTVGGMPVLVQRINGELRAFRNACPHKGMPIQIDPFGNRKLLCPYHGWSFQADGRIRGIPNKDYYNIFDSRKLDLDQIFIEIVGNFIFINISKGPQKIKEQIPENILKFLEKISIRFDPSISYTSFTSKYNWKLNFENILDLNHISFVHSKTFSPLLKNKNILDNQIYNTDNKEDRFFFEDIELKSSSKDVGEVTSRDLNWVSQIPLNYQTRWFSDKLSSFNKGYLLLTHIFPNLNFGCIHGETFYLQQYDPLAPDLTEFHSWVFTSKLKENIAKQPHLLWGIHHAEKRVIDEDRVLLEALQKSLTYQKSPPLLGDYEYRQHMVAHWLYKTIEF